MFFSALHSPFNIFIRQTLPFIHLCILQLPKPIGPMQAYLLGLLV